MAQLLKARCKSSSIIHTDQSDVLRLWPLGCLAFCSSGGGAKGDLLVALAGGSQRDVNARNTHVTHITHRILRSAFVWFVVFQARPAYPRSSILGVAGFLPVVCKGLSATRVLECKSFLASNSLR